MFNQIYEITLMNLRNLPTRMASSSVIVVGIAGVVGVLLGLLSMAVGFERSLAGAGQPDRAIIIQEASTSEMNGNLMPAQRDAIRAMEGVVYGGGEVYTVAAITKRDTDVDANVVVRGVEEEAFLVRPELKTVAGRRFEPGRAEVIVGVKAVSEFNGLAIGEQVQVRDQLWTVVGHFDTGGTAYDSELWADLANVQNAYRRGGTSSTMRLRMASEAAVVALDQRLREDPRFDVVARSEIAHYATQSRDRVKLITDFGYVVGVIMAIGAIFAALNTMYSAVSSRTVEIATLRALGFGGLPVVVSVMIEAMFLATLGGLLGAGLVWLIFDGYTASTLNNASFSQVAFDFAVTQELVQMGVLSALFLGFMGGLLPAWRAASLPITTALRGE